MAAITQPISLLERISQLGMRCDNLYTAYKNMEPISGEPQDRQHSDTPLFFNGLC